MNEELMKNAEASYELAEQKAFQYLKSLSAQHAEKTYVPILTKDIQSWKQNHIHHHSLFSLFSSKKKKIDSQHYHNYIQWLNFTGKLENYLERSISYIFLRDLGKSLDSLETQVRIKHVVNDLKNQLTRTTSEKGVDTDLFSMAKLYRMAQKEGIESTLIWVLDKLKTVSANIPPEMDAEEAKRKLIKIIAGVVMQEIEEMDDGTLPEERRERLESAIRLGYSYGLTYPFIDDLLDSDVLSGNERDQYTDLIRVTLITGSVPKLGEWTGSNRHLITYIHSELKSAFEYIKTYQGQTELKSFLEQAYVFFKSQEVDRKKDLSNGSYTNEELYIPVILKSAASRLIVRSIISAPEDEDIDNRTFYYGIYNQLADDFADMFDDMKKGQVTAYTYYWKYHKERPDLINPFELYWTVISNLIHQVYHSDTKTREVILNRAINGLKRYKKKKGDKAYNEVMAVFASGNPAFNRIIQQLVKKADDVDFFDKLLRDHMITNLKQDQKERENFLDTAKNARAEINAMLPFPKLEAVLLMNEPIVDAANYSLSNDGKRLRPIITWVMGIDEYGLDKSAITPLLKSLEYMHTASLIFDDLPSQDNADIRRGKSTLHQAYNIATAELTGLFLTQKAVEEQASLDIFDSKAVLGLIGYSARITAEMCRGQAMDLGSKGKKLTLDQLNEMCFYKTGLGFEAALIMPAILAGAGDVEIKALKKFAYHLGIAFQIKDDLLDVEGELRLLGKAPSKDAANNNSTFVSILGQDGARKEMWEHYCLAMEALQVMPKHNPFLKHLLNYIVNRDH